MKKKNFLKGIIFILSQFHVRLYNSTYQSCLMASPFLSFSMSFKTAFVTSLFSGLKRYSKSPMQENRFHRFLFPSFITFMAKWNEMKSLSCVRLFATPWTVAYKAPLSMGFSRQEYWSELPFPSPYRMSIEVGINPIQEFAWKSVVFPLLSVELQYTLIHKIVSILKICQVILQEFFKTFVQFQAHTLSSPASAPFST